jgi:hypothetical protein
MKRFFAPNLDHKGRLVRGLWALVLFVAAGFGFLTTLWLGGLLAVAGIFVMFEALRGWCALRACGIKTKL